MPRSPREFFFLMLGLLIGGVIFNATVSRPGEIALEQTLGAAEFSTRTDGVWWGGYGFNGRTRSQSVEIGVRKHVGDWGFYLGVAQLGEASGANLAAMRDDEYGRLDFTKPCDVSSQKNCPGYFTVRQQVAGFLGGVSYGGVVRGVRIDGEIGQFFYVSELNVTIFCPSCGTGSRYAFGEGGTFSSSSRLRRTPYVGARVSLTKHAYLGARRYLHIDGGGDGLQGIEQQFSTALTSGPVNQIFLVQRF